MNPISKTGHALGFLPSVGLPFFLVLCRCKGGPPYSTVQPRSMARQVLAFKTDVQDLTEIEIDNWRTSQW